MDSRMVLLYYLSSLAGLIMVAGGIWLLYKQKIYIDRESKAVTEIDTPVGKFKTNIPALALFVLGFFPLIYPIVKSSGFAQELKIKGNVQSNTFPVNVYAVIRTDALLQNRDFSLSVPLPGNATDDYKVLYVAGQVVLEDRADIQQKIGDEIRLAAKQIFPPNNMAFEPDVAPVPDEFLKDEK